MAQSTDVEWTVLLPDAAATQAFGYCLGQGLPPATTLLLQGDLGSGKTTLVQGIGQGLGIGDPIVSPTFTLINEYLEGRVPLYHFDLYRLEPPDVATLAPDLFWDKDEYEPGLVVIEWAERLTDYPSAYLELHLSPTEDGGRKVHGLWQGDLGAMTEAMATVQACLDSFGLNSDRGHLSV